ncbi:GNAT family N-acetyltransferase [Paenibacillus sp. 19GGS1-52]|uniref:GNAT family N-acetyltransferase n=1 Tax=Paenibacillus sp. 19GGS1-52 TaxID=2758563 RepID=UPI001EFAEB79|nr:GNAT family N-acetyltransferase [Paenibacillus sp. 19GGS1-52]ULO07633.1 GNAT family N-acetyltransferase [Paenibacillus sp. 19GGS1-52]
MGNIMESKVCQLISLISTGARNYVHDAFINQTITLVHYEESHDNHGVFCVVENVDCIIAYAAFSRYSHDETLINLMAKSLQRHLDPNETREVCFNIYGCNEEIVVLAKKLGFATDMEGFQLQYDFSKENKTLEMAPLVEKGFSSAMLDDFIQLFDKAYYNLKVENGWNTETPSKDAFLQSMLSYESEDRVRSFWIEDTLIGAYIIAGEFIRDFVILPEYQNRGYGSLMLKNCIHRMANIMGMKKIFLRVAKTNSGAKRFYERNDFIEQSNFAEHTFVSR